MFSNLLEGSSWVRNKMILVGFFFCFFIGAASAQNYSQEKKNFVYKQSVEPKGIETYKFSAYYYNGKKVYNLLGKTIGSKRKSIESIKMNPSGDSYAVLVKKGRNSRVYVYDLWQDDEIIEKYKRIKKASAVCFTPDAGQLLIADENYIHFYRAGKRKILDKTLVPVQVKYMEVSPDMSYIAAYNDSKLFILGLSDKKIIREFEFAVKVNDIAFSKDSKTFAVLTADGVLSLYDTAYFSILQDFDMLGDAKSCSFHHDGTHVSVVTADNRIALLNLANRYDRNFIDNETGGINYAEFVTDGKNRVYLCYNTKESIIYEYMDEILSLSDYKLLSNELDERMEEWMQMMPGESLEDYNLRMSEENRMKQMRLFEQEISTRMAENLVQNSDISFGSYNPEKNMLALNFDNMPSIYLDVPSEDVNDFMNPGLLEFHNEKYVMGEDEKFELTYAEVYNTASGKKYIFDNQERMSLDFLKSDEDFIPLNFVQQSNMEEIKLQKIKDEVVSTAKKNSVISDHTNITVDAKIVPSYDENGNRINNYRINFSYEVENAFSVHEDFAPGKYKIDDSGAAKSMVSIIKTALETEFSQYVKEGKKLQVSVTGMADALQINNRITYDGIYGDFTDEPVYQNDKLGGITVTKSTGITQNEQLAFLRAVGVKEYIRNNVDRLNEMDVDYRYNINLTSGTGGQFRRITVDFTFVDAFMQ